MSWPNNRLTQLLGIDYPLIQAPMAGGVTTPELVAAVSNAGGLGSLGAGYMKPEAIRQAIAAIRQRTDRPFAVNLFVSEPVKEEAQRVIAANRLLAPYREALNLPEPEPLLSAVADDSEEFTVSLEDSSEMLVSTGANYHEQVAVVLEEGIDRVSFTFGIPSDAEIATFKQRGVITIGTATHVLEGIVLEETGIDVVVAQGMEAGGHRGTFIGRPEQGLLSLMTLIPILVDQLRIPVVAAGGIMDGRGIAAAHHLGASGVQMGTAFLTTPESGAHSMYKQALLDTTEMSTVLTKVFSGKLARGLQNRFITELSEVQDQLPGYPIQNALTRDIRRAAAEHDMPELMSLWAGTGCALCQSRPVAELMRQWLDQAAQYLKP